MRKLSMDPRDSFPQDARLRHRCGGSTGVGWATVNAGLRAPNRRIPTFFPSRSCCRAPPRSPRCSTGPPPTPKTSVCRRPFEKVGALPTAELPADSARDMGITTPDVSLQTPEHAPRTSVHAAERSIGGGWRCSDHRVGHRSGVAQWPGHGIGEARAIYTSRAA
jgi:hypothetical protein